MKNVPYINYLRTSDVCILNIFAPICLQLFPSLYAHPRLSKFKCFEVWIISDCPAFDTDLVQYFHGNLLSTYQKHLHDNNIWVQHIERYMLETIPCMLLVNSFSQDRDDLIVAELQERLQRADITHDGDPPFYTTWCSVATSDLSRSTLAKCIMAHPLVAPVLTMAIMALPLDDTADFLISGDYTPLPITPPQHPGTRLAITQSFASWTFLPRWSPLRFLVSPY